ncbi:MAG: peptide chain release factor 3 [Planctomycetes bacterium]|jgi:peptide chain release factor 3|nr:peptide chain release factor 3 [Planctomycetota bacterium]
MADLDHEIQRRRTFAIISHPDAGKTTLTEKLLLYGGAIREAGSVKARRGGAHATSDWMELEKKRGISITSSALQFEYQGHCINLLDTPGHQDFSEDTFRTLVAADAALMLIDGAKGVEPQTIKLFKVCRDRGIPIVTVVNKMDRPARPPLDLMDEVEKVLGITIVPATWPIGSGENFRGVYSLRDQQVFLFERTAHNATKALVQTTGPHDPALREQLSERAHKQLLEDLAMVETCVQPFDMQQFLHQKISPMFFCSALVNFGVENILQRFLEIAPAPGPLPTLTGDVQPNAPFFSGFVYKVAANMDKMHRDRIAFLRVCSGRFERGMSAKHLRLNREVRLSHPHRFFGQERVSIEEAFPGDVIGLINPGMFRVGDVLSSGPTFEVRNFPRFAPEIFAQVAPREPSMSKSFGKGLEQLGEEGVVQVFWPRFGAREPILGAIGELQLEVFQWRLENEYNVQLRLDRKAWSRARWIDNVTDEVLEVLPMVVKDEAGRFVALFHSDFEIDYAKSRYKGLQLLDAPPAEEEG